MCALGFVLFHALGDAVEKVTGCGHMQPFYFFLKPSAYEDNLPCVRHVDVNLTAALGGALPSYASSWGDMILDPLPRAWISPPIREAWDFVRTPSGWPAALHGDKPLVVISNKFTREFFIGRGQVTSLSPTNYLSIDTVSRLIDAVVQAGGNVVYNRAGKLVVEDDAATGQASLPFADKQFITDRARNATDTWAGRVHLAEWLLEANGDLSYNDALVAAMGRAECFVSVQGGTSWVSALFGRHQVIQHAAGMESRRAYQRVFPLLGLAHSLTVTRNGEETVARLRQLLQRGDCSRSWPAASLAASSGRRVSSHRVMAAHTAYRELVDAQPRHDFARGPYSWPPGDPLDLRHA